MALLARPGVLQRCYRSTVRGYRLQACLTTSARPSIGTDKKVKDEANCVIIGGGCIGTSLAYHLAKQGMKDVILLEKTELTAGSTWHAAGLTTAYHPGINLKHMHWYSLNLYASLEEETGQPVGFHRPGSLRLLTTPGRVKEAEYMMSRANWHKLFIKVLTPEQCHAMVPYMRMDDVLGGLFTPGDGHTDPYSLTQALAIGAKKYGADIYLNSPVKALKRRPDGRWDVVTPHGTIKAQQIVNTAGFWAQEIGRLVGVEHPLTPIHHQYVVTSPIECVKKNKPEIPVIRDLEGSYYLREERGGLLFGPYEKCEKMRIQEDWWDGVPAGFGKELFESDLDRIMEHVEAAMSRFPCIQGADIQSVIAGPITYTPDILPMLGPFPEVPNYWVGAGFGYGVIHAGGAGKYLADWIQNGEPPYDLNELDPGRYGKWTTKKYVLEKARESYGFNNLQIYPKEERYGGRPMRTTPLYKAFKDAGAQFTFSSGWEVPKWFAQPGDDAGYKPSYQRTNWFEPVGREVRKTLESVTVSDVSAFAKLYVSGKGAAPLLDYLVANNLPKVGGTNVSHMLAPSGKVYAEVTVSALADDHYLVITGGGSEFHDLRWMLEHAPKFSDVTIANRTDELTAIAVAGPSSRAVLQKLTKQDLSNAAFKFMANQSITMAGKPVLALRVSYTGELGWELYVENQHALHVYSSIMEAGREFGIGHLGGYGINSMRIEKGFRLWGAEMNMDVGPYEAGLGFFIKLNKGCNFIGREALLKKKQQLLEKKLACMIVDTKNVDAEGNETLWYMGKVCGNTTSGCYGYQVGKSIAYGYLPAYLYEPGVQVEVELMGSRYTATVVPEPLVPIEAARSRRATQESRKV